MEGGGRDRPLLAFDHALIAVPDLDESLRKFEQRFGLVATLGGRHPGVGTANAIVSLGGRQYLELIAVVDAGEAASSKRGQRIAEALARGSTFATWVLRSDDLERDKARLGISDEILPGSRVRRDGTRLEWRTVDFEPPGLPFLISWAGAEHPGADGDGRVVRLVLEDRADGPLRALLEGVEVDVDYAVRVGPEARMLQIELESGGQTLTIS